MIEWLLGSVMAFVLAGIFHSVAIHGMTDDIETWSGQITQARHFSAWREYYEEAIYRYETRYRTVYYTDSKGRSQSRVESYTVRVFDHWEPRQRWHSDSYSAVSNIDTSYWISAATFNHISGKFADRHAVAGDRTTGEHNSRMIEGDPNDYVSDNKTGWVEPITSLRKYENRIKAAPSVFSFPPVPKDIKTFPYPENDNPWQSDRLVGSAVLVDKLAFDQMNSRLGPLKKVNVILVGAGDKDSMFGKWQEAAWIRGRKNDFVIVYGGPNSKPTWVYTFSWGEGRALKDVESIILEKGVSTDILPEIESAIKQTFTKADWHRYDHISIPIAARYVWYYLATLVVFQTAFYIFAYLNPWDKQLSATSRSPYPYRYRYSRF